nr:lipid II flippase MurJ [Pseudonocardia sp. ICBG1142]
MALFSIGAGGGSGAERLGLTVAWSAFGILPYAVMMLQIRVFYAQGDSRTPTLIQLWLITLKVPLLLLCPMVLPSEQVVIGIAAVNSLLSSGPPSLANGSSVEKWGRFRSVKC